MLANPSSLLFAVEKPNIFRDVLLVPSLLREVGISDAQAADRGSERVLSLATAIKANPSLAPGPLGLAGNELASRWAATYLVGVGTETKELHASPELALLQACV